MKSCCQTEEDNSNNTPSHHHTDNGADERVPEHNHEHGAENGEEDSNFWKENGILLFGMFAIVVQLVLAYGFQVEIPKYWALGINGIAYILAGKKVLALAWRKASRGDFFNEFVLMSVATLGAFYLGEYTEGLAVMVFYAIGEWFQDSAVRRAKGNIKALLDSRPDQVEVIRNGVAVLTSAKEVVLDEVIRVKAGEKVGLDGVIVSDKGLFNTAALTGESKPDTKYQGEQVLAGMINLNFVIDIQVKSLFKDSKLSKILEMVQDASAQKSQTQLFISQFAKVYTPIVFFLAFTLVILPYFFLSDYGFQDWLYRGLVFLVISCPCALVVSIPLGYFGGIGLASKQGILFKGGNFLDVLTQIDCLVSDKTGTLTWGLFEVKQIESVDLDQGTFMQVLTALESHSTHPIAKAILVATRNTENLPTVTQVEEISGKGLKGIWDDKVVLAGNTRLMEVYQISYPEHIKSLSQTVVLMAVDGEFAGYVTIADRVKENAALTVQELNKLGVETVMLSGDKWAVVRDLAQELKIEKAYGDLLPEDKVTHVNELKAAGRRVAFVGDGINDAPVLALADAGIAMGGLGADAAIETADIVIQNDNIYKLVTAIKVAKITRRIVWQNIILAMSIKLLVLALGAGGIANLWEAVIADVGVALLAILNAVRIQHTKFEG